MARSEDLVTFKAMAARPKDVEDAAALLRMHRDIDTDRVRRRLGELAAAADEPALVAGFEQLLRQPAAPVVRLSAGHVRETTPRVRRSSPKVGNKTKRPRR